MLPLLAVSSTPTQGAYLANATYIVQQRFSGQANGEILHFPADTAATFLFPPPPLEHWPLFNPRGLASELFALGWEGGKEDRREVGLNLTNKK